ncbi:hypothetical protein IC757_09665 [Wenzhouxiangella sp. AB-CW3]|uniref:hypothetical protein n=1 Tax=Wenzhouxiangella sp. AB-CW3 TaxID=2771012 RepID=UPI00168B99E0|nr:hypothetical protein [Wenzhouxiangella sp. AB-CW3]QOC21322.1 hypothetical protein IC757_09665 [Wenzhouxiangella sp. AB-CW3]
MKHLYTLFVLALCSISVLAEEVGPYAPACPGCPEFKKPPYPKSGLWFDPERSGTGINIDVQNGIMAAVYYGYREDGEPVWYTFSGKLEKSEGDNSYRELEADLYRTTNGEVINGEYRHPDYEVVGNIHFEVMQRHLIRFSIDGGSYRRLVPQVFGSGQVPLFEPEASYRLPQYTAEHEGVELDVTTSWIIMFYKNEDDPDEFDHSRETHVLRNELMAKMRVPSDESHLSMTFWEREGNINVQHAGDIDCRRADDFSGQNVLPEITGDEPLCIAYTFHPVPDDEIRLFYMPIGNLGDRSFQAVSPDGWVMEGIRVDYNY